MFAIKPDDVKLMLNHVISHYKQTNPFPLNILGEELTECGMRVEGLTNFKVSLPNNMDAEVAYIKLFHFLFRMATIRLMGLPMDQASYKEMVSVLNSISTVTGFAAHFQTILLADRETGRYVLNLSPTFTQPVINRNLMN